MGTNDPAKGTSHPRNIIAVDFGVNDALAIHGKDGRIPKPKLPRVKGGKSTSDDFTMVLPILLQQGDVVVESPTIGSSGVEAAQVAEIVDEAPHDLYVLSARAVKNYRQDHALTWRKGARYAKNGTTPPAQTIEIEEQVVVHVEDAEIIYKIAVEYPGRLKRWRTAASVGTHNPATGTVYPRLVRGLTSVRPHDKRNYRGDIPDRYMSRFPPFALLPPDLRELLGNGVATKAADYSRARAMPFAMALDEDGAETRSGYERILGLYDHGYPSFYRRATIVLLQANAKRMAGVTRIGEVPPAVRKKAWKVTRRQVRHVYHLLRA